MEKVKSIMYLATDHLEEATKIVNTKNDMLDVGISQEEVIEFILTHWVGEEYLTPLMYKGMVILPQLVDASEEGFSYTVHIAVAASFTKPDRECLEIYSLDLPEEGEVSH